MNGFGQGFSVHGKKGQLTCSCLLIIVATPLYSDLLALVLQVCKEVHYQAGLILTREGILSVIHLFCDN